MFIISRVYFLDTFGYKYVPLIIGNIYKRNAIHNVGEGDAILAHP